MANIITLIGRCAHTTLNSQTETLMHQLITERNGFAEMQKEEERKWEGELNEIRKESGERLEVMRRDTSTAQRELIMQKRLNVDLRKEMEEFQKKLKQTKESTDNLLDRNRQVLEEEKKAFAHRINTDKSLIENTKKMYEKRLEEKDSQYKQIVGVMEEKYKAEKGKTEETFNTLKMEYANRALMFEKEVEKIKDLAEAAKIKSEAGMFKLKTRYEERIKDLERSKKTKTDEWTKMRWCNVMRINAYQRRIARMEKDHEEEMERMKRAGELAVGKVREDIGVKAREEREAHMRAQHDHEMQLMQLHKELMTKDEEVSESKTRQ